MHALSKDLQVTKKAFNRIRVKYYFYTQRIIYTASVAGAPRDAVEPHIAYLGIVGKEAWRTDVKLDVVHSLMAVIMPGMVRTSIIHVVPKVLAHYIQRLLANGRFPKLLGLPSASLMAVERNIPG